MLQLQTLGTLDLRTADGSAVDSLLAHPRTLALLVALMLLRPRGFQRRDRLCAMFWPDSDDAHARGALNQALSRLRRAVGAATIETRAVEEVRVVDGVLACDALAFEDAVERGDHAAALSLYRGTLLQSFHLRDADGFEEWLEEERTRLRLRAAQSARDLMRQLLGSGRITDAGTLALQTLALEPASELMMRQLVDALVARGDGVGAVRIFEGWSERLMRELQVAPSPEFRGVIRDIRQASLKQTPLPQPRAQPADRGQGPAGASSRTGGQGPPAGLDVRPTSGPAVARDWLALRARGGLAFLTGGRPTSAASPSGQDARPSQPRAAAGPRTLGDWRRATGRVALLGLAGAVTLGGVLFVTMRGADAERFTDRIVVLPFENHTGDVSLDWLGHMAADWVSRGLMQLSSLEIVPADRTRLGPERVPGAGQGSIESARELGRTTRAGTVVGGAYYLQGDSIWLSARFLDTSTGRMLPAPGPVGAPRSMPLQGVEALLHIVAGALLHQRVPAIPGFAEFLDERPPSHAAYGAYLAGAGLFVARDWEAALDRFLDAHRADSTYLTPLVSAVTAATNLGRFAVADSLLAIVAPARARLAPNDAFFFRYHQACLRGDRAEALHLARAQLDAYPGSGYELITAVAELNMNRPAAAAALLEPIKDRTNYARWTGLWIELGRAHHARGNHRAELRTADAAAARFPGEPWALELQVHALAALGRTQALERRLDEVERIGPAGSPQVVGILRNAARELEIHGYPDAADLVRMRALRRLRSRPPEERSRAAPRRAEAWTLFDLGRPREVLAIVQPLLRHEPDDLDLVALYGMAAAAVGDEPSTALAQASIRRIGAADPYDAGRHLRLLAFVAAQQADAGEAVRLLREARVRGDLPDEALHRALAGELRPVRDDPALRTLLEPSG
jgi:DNA-binding SARP family transcriptional activator/tetratricopeptide (TPR) repeat protein/TolB-like protein